LPVSIGRVITAYCLAAALGLIALFLISPLHVEPRSEWLLLPGLALLAEFLPVQLSRRGLRITFTLPYVAGMAVALGATAAVTVEVLVTLLVGTALNTSGQSRIAPRWLAANVAIASLCACAGSLALAALPHDAATGALVFTLTYGITNLLCVALLDFLVSGNRINDNLLTSLKMGAQAVGLYCLTAMAVAVLISDGLTLWVALTIVPVLLIRAVIEQHARLYEQYYETISGLTLMLQRAHPYTHGHIERVAKVAEDVALRLGLSASRARLVREAAVLHDIGKLAVDEEILDAPRKLTEEEMDHVRRHSAYGAEILGQSSQFRDVARWILHHHERPDGTGYPLRLRGVEIPVESKIIAVADAYDAMTGGDEPSERRPYRKPMSQRDALQELHACCGKQFDYQVVRAFSEVLTGGSA
jgi:putative nucleotidyltransferase with HDIG domain